MRQEARRKYTINFSQHIFKPIENVQNILVVQEGTMLGEILSRPLSQHPLFNSWKIHFEFVETAILYVEEADCGAFTLFSVRDRILGRQGLELSCKDLGCVISQPVIISQFGQETEFNYDAVRNG